MATDRDKDTARWIETKERLDELYEKYNDRSFFATDPIAIPSEYSRREDIEIAGLLSSVIAWGRRDMIYRNAKHLQSLLAPSPYEFVMNASDDDLKRLEVFVHRTFNGRDLISFVAALRRMYGEYGTLGDYFEQEYARTNDMKDVLSQFRRDFFMVSHEARCEKHIGSVDRGAACKRLNMMLRWFVRKDNVDLGIWTGIPASALYLPLDVHSANISREFGLLERRQNDWKAVEEVTAALREFSPEDPVKYDFALFGLGYDRANK